MQETSLNYLAQTAAVADRNAKLDNCDRGPQEPTSPSTPEVAENRLPLSPS